VVGLVITTDKSHRRGCDTPFHLENMLHLHMWGARELMAASLAGDFLIVGRGWTCQHHSPKSERMFGLCKIVRCLLLLRRMTY